MNSPEELRNDIMYLAKRLKALEDTISEWSEFMTAEVLKNDISLYKHKNSDSYFKHSISDKFKQDYEKMETLFSIIRKKKGTSKYD